MIKVLFVINQLAIGGAERQLAYLVSGLDQAKYRPLVCSLSTNTAMLPELEKAGIETVIFPKVMSPDMTRLQKLYRLIQDFQPDLIHSFLNVANIWSRLLGTMLGIPVIVSERSSDPAKPITLRMIDRILAPFGTCLIANSWSGANRVIAAREFSPEKVKVVYNGLAFSRFNRRVDENTKRATRRSLNILEGHRVIGIIGRMDTPKNHRLLFESFRQLRDRCDNICLLCVGDGRLRDNLCEAAKKAGIEKDVIFAGWRRDIDVCLSILDVLVLPSLWEGFPNVILEAMAARCPVVATDVGGVGEIVKDSETGWLVQSNDARGMADKIQFVLSSPERVKDVTEKAFRFVTENFSVESMVANTVEIYDNVLGNKVGVV